MHNEVNLIGSANSRLKMSSNVEGEVSFRLINNGIFKGNVNSVFWVMVMLFVGFIFGNFL